MAIDPQILKVFAMNARRPDPDFMEAPVEELEAVREAMNFNRIAGGQGETMDRVVDFKIAGGGGREIALRAYYPMGVNDEGPGAVVVYFHGGGWFLGNLETHDHMARMLAKLSGCVVVAVDYRLAPEDAFPAAVEDAYAATKYVAMHGEALDVDVDRLGLAGDSAGGNLAAAVTLMARDREDWVEDTGGVSGVAIKHQALIYPVIDADFERASYIENGEEYGLTREMMMWFWDQYAPSGADRMDPLAAPIRAADLTGLPEAYVQSAELDPLRDEAEAYAGALERAGVKVKLKRYDGMTHAFVSMFKVVDAGQGALEDVAAEVRRALK